MIKFIGQHDKNSPVVTIKIPGNEQSLVDVFDQFKAFLVAYGFSIEGVIDVVKEGDI